MTTTLGFHVSGLVLLLLGAGVQVHLQGFEGAPPVERKARWAFFAVGVALIAVSALKFVDTNPATGSTVVPTKPPVVGTEGVASTTSSSSTTTTGAPPTTREDGLRRCTVAALANCVTELDSSAALDTHRSWAAGVLLHVRATGRWASGPSSASGALDSDAFGQTRLPGESIAVGTLVGYLGSLPMPLDQSATWRVPPGSPSLRLGFWDCSGTCGDNFGDITVEIDQA